MSPLPLYIPLCWGLNAIISSLYCSHSCPLIRERLAMISKWQETHSFFLFWSIYLSFWITNGIIMMFLRNCQYLNNRGVSLKLSSSRSDNNGSLSSSDSYDERNSYRDMFLIYLCCSEISFSVIMDPQCHAISPLCPWQLRDGWISATEKDFVFMQGDQ